MLQKVVLLAHTPEPEKVVAAAAKLCYAHTDIETLMEGLTPEKSREFIVMLAGLGHGSPTEHANFTFGIEGVSRSVLAQITRHRIATFSVQSQRYVKLDNFEYVVPPEIAGMPEAEEAFGQAMQMQAEQYKKLTDILQEKHYNSLLQAGETEKEARKKAAKQAIEDARFVLPNACTTSMIVTMNARSLNNFFRLRCCNRAQWEIHDLADKMLKLVVEVAPALFEAAGPACVCGACSEGKMTCGKAKEVCKKYAELKREAVNG